MNPCELCEDHNCKHCNLGNSEGTDRRIRNRPGQRCSCIPGGRQDHSGAVKRGQVSPKSKA